VSDEQFFYFEIAKIIKEKNYEKTCDPPIILVIVPLLSPDATMHLLHPQSAVTTAVVTSKPTTTPTAVTPRYSGTLKILAGASMDNIGYPAAATPPWRPFLPAPVMNDLLRKNESGSPVPIHRLKT
jgi:hypothetical protein